jgi:hypothetical protein
VRYATRLFTFAVFLFAAPRLLAAEIFPDQPLMDQVSVSTTGDHQHIMLGTGYSGSVTSATVRIGFPNTDPASWGTGSSPAKSYY